MQETNNRPTKFEFILFTTDTCHKCPAFKEEINQSGLGGVFMDNKQEDFLAIAQSFGVQKVPTVVVLRNGQPELTTDDINEFNNFIK